MRILKGHDYYDNAGEGASPGPVFLREERRIEGFPVIVPAGAALRSGPRSWMMRFSHVVIGGDLMPVVRFGETRPPLWDTAWSHAWTEADAISEISRALRSFPNALREGWSPFLGDAPEDRVRRHFSGPHPSVRSWCLDNEAIVALAQRVVGAEMAPFGRVEVRVNGDFLREVDAAMIVSPEDAHARIARSLRDAFPRDAQEDATPVRAGSSALTGTGAVVALRARAPGSGRRGGAGLAAVS